MNELVFPRMNDTSALVVLNCIQPQFVDTFVRSELQPLFGTLVANNEARLIDRCSRIAKTINERYITPNFGKHIPVMACQLTEEEGENQVAFLIPTSKTDFVSIKLKRDLGIHIRWSYPVWRETAHLMARLVYGNDLTGRVTLVNQTKDSAGIWQEERWVLSYRAALIVCCLGADYGRPMVDMASDGLLEDYECVSLTMPKASGLKKKSKENPQEYLEL